MFVLSVFLWISKVKGVVFHLGLEMFRHVLKPVMNDVVMWLAERAHHYKA